MARFRAAPYAKALHEVVRASYPGRAEEVADELGRVVAALEQVPDLLKVLVTPMVGVETKTAILDQVLDTLGVSEPVRPFVHVVQHHYRMAQLAQMLDAYRDLVDRALGRTRAHIELAHTPPPADRDALIAAVASVVGTDVVADFVENPDLLAGFKVQVGSKVFDGSLVAQIDRLSRQTHFG